MPEEPKPPVPAEEYPIDFFSDTPPISGKSEREGGARGKLPPPVSGDRGWARPVKSGTTGDFWVLVGCNAIVFGASVCIMVLELTASRLIANYIGQSLYTWTSVIGVVLAGISIGNYIGGGLADRYPPQKVLGWLFTASGILTCSVIPLNIWAASASRPENVTWQLWVMLVVAWVFFLPALTLGTISPVTASMALKRSAKTGITVGNIYAWGALGSIVGTFLTGFWLIGQFGSHVVIAMTACALLLMGALVASGQRGLRALALFAALPFVVQCGIISSTTSERMGHIARTIAGIRSGWKTTQADIDADEAAVEQALDRNDETALSAARNRQAWRKERRSAEEEWEKWGAKLGSQLHELGRTLALRRDDPHEYIRESDYYTIKIADGREHGDRVKVLTLDHLIHSYWNPDQPAKLYYDYELVYAAITERAAAMSGRSMEVPLESLPGGDDMSAAFPPDVKYDRVAKTLSARGTMDYPQLRALLTIGPHAEFSKAMFKIFELAWNDWPRISRLQGGELLTDLRELPPGVSLPATMSQVHYDSARKSLVCTGPFRQPELIEFLAQAEMEPYVRAVWELFQRSRHTSTLFIGGGGFVFPRWVEQMFPHKPRIDVAEIDPAVKAAIEEELGLAREYGSPDEGKTYVRTHIGDARKFVDDRLRENKQLVAAGQPPVTYDFVYGDAFNDLSVPWHLTTKEFSERVKALLTPGQGVYMVNIIDIYPRVRASITTDPTAAASYAFPPGLAPDDPPDDVWQSAPAPYAALQFLRTEHEGLTIGFRGVMSSELRDELQKHAGADEQLRSAIEALYVKSRTTRVGQFLGRYLNTVRGLFPFVYLFSSNQEEPGASRDTFIVACSLHQLDFTNILASGNYWPRGPFAWIESDASEIKHDYGEMPSVLQLARNHELTDDFAPVDNLLAPVFVNRSGSDD